MAKITACSTLTYPGYSFEEAAGRIAARGFRQVDIAHMGFYCTHFPLGDEDCRRIATVLERHELQPVALNYYGGTESWSHVLNLPEEVRAYREMMTAVFKQASRLGIPKVMAFMGRRATGPDVLDRIRAAATVISEVADEANQLGIQITVEVPHAYSLASDVSAVAEFFEHVTSPHVGACVDCSHWGLIGYDFDDLMAAIGDRLIHVHLRDSAGDDDGTCDQDLELTPGKGQVDFARFGTLLEKYGYDGEVTLETEYKGFGLAAIETELDDALAHLSRCGWEMPDEVKEMQE